MPEDGPLLADTSEDDGGHVVEDEAQGDAAHGLEGAGEALEQRGLALVAVEAHVQVARVGEHAAERVHAAQDAVDRHVEDGPINLHLFADRGLEAPLGRLGRGVGGQVADVVSEDGPAALVALLTDLAQDAGDGEALGDLVANRLAEGVELADLVRGGAGRDDVHPRLLEDPAHRLAVAAHGAGGLAQRAEALVGIEDLLALLGAEAPRSLRRRARLRRRVRLVLSRARVAPGRRLVVLVAPVALLVLVFHPLPPPVCGELGPGRGERRRPVRLCGADRVSRGAGPRPGVVRRARARRWGSRTRRDRAGLAGCGADAPRGGRTGAPERGEAGRGLPSRVARRAERRARSRWRSGRWRSVPGSVAS